VLDTSFPLGTSLSIDDRSWLFGMGCDATAECFRPLDTQSLDRRRAVGHEYERAIHEVIRPIQAKLRTLPEEHRGIAADDVIYGILISIVSLRHGDLRQLAQDESNVAESLTADAADSAAEATGP
jgi:hypothetical protein